MFFGTCRAAKKRDVVFPSYIEQLPIFFSLCFSLSKTRIFPGETSDITVRHSRADHI